MSIPSRSRAMGRQSNGMRPVVLVFADLVRYMLASSQRAHDKVSGGLYMIGRHMYHAIGPDSVSG